MPDETVIAFLGALIRARSTEVEFEIKKEEDE